MKFSASKLGLLALVGVLLLSGCSKLNDNQLPQESTNETTIESKLDTTAETTVDPASGTSLKLDEATARAMQFDRMIEGIKSITLKDIEGNVVDRSFSEDEIVSIETAFNESYIMDTAYIEMITGYTMTIALESGEEVFITSYGDSVFIVARIGEGETYHLGCETIAKILLEGTK